MKQEVRRGRKFVEYHDPDTQDANTFTQEISGADVSYQDEAGNWLATDENWETDGADGFSFRASRMNHKVRFDSIGAWRWYPRRNVETEYLVLNRPQCWLTGTKRWGNLLVNGISREGKDITLTSLRKVTRVIHSRWNGIKTDWILEDASAPTRFRQKIDLVGITEIDGVLYGADGERLATLTPTTATDANGTELACTGSYSGGYVEFSVTPAGGVYPITVDPDFADTPTIDAYINKADAITNFPNDPMRIGVASLGTSHFRGLISWDVSSIDSGVTVSAASITLRMTTSTNNTITSSVKVYRLLKTWVENQVTWNIYSTGNNWTAAGGFHSSDCEQIEIGSFNALDVGSYQFSVTAAKVKEWIDGTLTNNGVLLRDAEDTSNSYKRYASSENATSGYRPLLSVTYTTGGALRRINTSSFQQLTGGIHG